jgi:hypothetical protein
MPFKKLSAVLAVIAVGIAAVTAIARANAESKAAPRAPTGAAVAIVSDATCPKEPWPYGCQWREPTRRVAPIRRAL